MPFLALWIGLFALIGLQAKASTGLTIPLCCPNGDWRLARISSDGYACLNTTITNTTNDLENTSALYGWGILRPEEHHKNSSVPICEGQSFEKFTKDNDVKISSTACLMGQEDEVLSVSCPKQSSGSVVSLAFIHKCCPNNYVYDISQRKCVATSEPNIFLYSTFLKSATVFNDQPVNCPRDKVLVEYQVDEFKFSIANGRLDLRPAKKIFLASQYCIEAMDSGSSMMSNSTQMFLVRTCDDVSSVCKRMPCIRRCCTDGEMFAKGNGSYCRRDESDIGYHSFESLDISGNFSKPSVFGILHSLDCPKMRLDPDAFADEVHSISERDGSLIVSASRQRYTNGQYCIEKIRNASWTDQKLYSFICFDSKVVGSDGIRFKVYTIGILISCCFYAATLVVYLSIARLRNLPGKILICLVTSLFTAYLGIALAQLMPTSNNTVCFASGFFIYFCLMAAFSWMNVMCFDIWQTFGSTKKKHGFKGNDTKRFLFYSLYGWGLPTLITSITVTLTKTEVLSEKIRPNFGHGRCWFTYQASGPANLLFFSGPVGVLYLINLVFFILTLRYCNRVKREIFRMQSSNADKPVMKQRFFVDKTRFAMNTKLFLVMGITWFLELLSIVFYNHKKIFFWAISDTFNVLLGVFIFFIFVFKKRVWHSVLERVGLRSSASMKYGPNTTIGTNSTYTLNNVSMMRLNALDVNSSLLTPNAARRAPTM